MWIVYKTTNNKNNKYYIGVHKVTTGKKDTYLGSGKALLNAVKKYGRDSFTRVTLAEFSNELDAYSFEKDFLTEEHLKNTNCYNITEGGGNPPTFYGKDNYFYGKTLPEEMRKKSKPFKKGNVPWNKGVPRTDEEKKNISKAKKGKKLGPKNSLYGKKLTIEERRSRKLVDFEKGHIPWNKGIKGSPPPYSTKCIVHDCFFNSTTEAGKCFGVSRATIRRRCTKYAFPDCYYIM